MNVVVICYQLKSCVKEEVGDRTQCEMCRCEDEHSVKCFIQYQIRIFPSIQDLVCNLSKVVAMLCRLVVLVNR